MEEIETLRHTTWDCKYPVVFLPKYRRQALYKELRRHLGAVFRSLAQQKECRVEEGHLLPEHVQMLLSIPPKYSVAQIVGFIKGKSAIHSPPAHRSPGAGQERRAGRIGAVLEAAAGAARRRRHNPAGPLQVGRARRVWAPG